MSGETEKAVSGWSVDTLKAHYDQRFIDNEKAISAALASAEKAVSAALVAAEKAVEKAETNAEKWRANANEWRQAMNDREGKFANSQQMETEIKNIRADILSLRESRAAGGGADLRGRAVKDDSRLWIGLAISTIVAALLIARYFGGR